MSCAFISILTLITPQGIIVPHSLGRYPFMLEGNTENGCVTSRGDAETGFPDAGEVAEVEIGSIR